MTDQGTEPAQVLVRPRPVKIIASLAALTAIAFGLIAAWGVIRFTWPDWQADKFPELQFEWLTFALALFGAYVARSLWLGKPRGPAFALAFFVFAIGYAVETWPLPRPDTNNLLFTSLEREPTFWERLLSNLSADAWRGLHFLVGMAIALPIGYSLLFEGRVRTWCDASSADIDGVGSGLLEGGLRSNWVLLLRLLGIAAILFLFVGIVGVLVWPVWWPVAFLETYSTKWIPFDLGWVGDIVIFLTTPLAFFAAAGVFVWVAAERLVINEGGVSLYLFRPKYCLFRASWAQVRRVDVVLHSKKPPSAVVHYRSRFRLPFSIGVHAKRYPNGPDVVQDLIRRAREGSIPVIELRSPDWMPAAAWLLILLGAASSIAMHGYSASLMQEMSATEFPIDRLDDLAGTRTLPLLYLMAPILMGVGLGLLSAYHMGGLRPILMGMWMVGSTYLPDPLVHWLVWAAICAILIARQTPIQPYLTGPPVPSPEEWEMAFTIIRSGPMFAGIAYVLGVYLGCRRVHQTVGA